MVNESTLPTLFRAISNFEIEADLKTLHKPLMELLQILVAKFCNRLPRLSKLIVSSRTSKRLFANLPDL